MNDKLKIRAAIEELNASIIQDEAYHAKAKNLPERTETWAAMQEKIERRRELYALLSKMP